MEGPEQTPSFHTLPESLDLGARDLVQVLSLALRTYCQEHPDTSTVQVTSALAKMYAMAWADIAVKNRVEKLLPKAMCELESYIGLEIRTLQ